MRDFHLPGRSPVRVSEAAAATSHPLATLAAIDILKEGGNAIDAAVAASAVLAVVEPQSTGLGGDAFLLYVPKGGSSIVAYNGSGKSPASATLEWYLDREFTKIPDTGPHSVTIPGAVDAWARIMRDHGKKDLGRVLQAAIRYADEGCIIADRVAFDWQISAHLLAANPAASSIFLPGQRAPCAGERHRQPQLAETLRQIAVGGSNAFYRGRIAQHLVQTLRALGGLHTEEDFERASGLYVDPISVTYRGTQIFQMPPNNQGLTALLMLNVLSGTNIGDISPLAPRRFHLEIEAGKLAFEVRDSLIADPDFSSVPTEHLLSSAFAAELHQRINESSPEIVHRASLSTADTVYVCVVDKDRNVASFINSIFRPFGSGVVCPNTGILLQNRGSSFRLQADHPNRLEANKRPLHTIMPGMAMRNGRPLMPFGVMGGDFQAFGNVQLLVNIIDHEMDPQQALDSPRVFPNQGVLEVERGLYEDIVSSLLAMGHQVSIAEKPHGGGQAILIDWQAGTLTAGSDFRKDGCALGY